ncbi:protein of unknown function [Georgfuchsia toluolica]|uniref:Uncharacterized protein n=1 Tax=Georgfuchsia toluolica TaxID=424218 RepID=A0A916J6C9_9PROT|nr:protein of unknown function [Georgfuchsia toluolica]
MPVTGDQATEHGLPGTANRSTKKLSEFMYLLKCLLVLNASPHRKYNISVGQVEVTCRYAPYNRWGSVQFPRYAERVDFYGRSICF